MEVIDDQLIADLGTATPGWLEIADVIVQRDSRNTAAAEWREWFAATFARYPGCAVAALADTGCGHLVGLRDGQAIGFTSRLGRGQGPCGTPPDAGRYVDRDAGWDAVAACASLTHLWAASGRRLAVLNSVSLQVTGTGRTASYSFMCRHHPAR